MSFETAIDKAVHDLADKQEAFLLTFFGSHEQAEKWAPLYVIETESSEIQTIDHKYSITQTMRLRLKTPEELAAERKS